ncbi:hypothetical protein DS380_24010 [Salmonella enterica subsp. enterica serovar Bareilly]|mgnify:CR=1 FL=1|nr:hypothetical protein [Salmonella enterica subsp. enterica serovar Bareilly]EMA8584779.1 hypothetical protein [Escherichia coli]HEA4739207.1 hypothetical protein [Escherichia coli]
MSRNPKTGGKPYQKLLNIQELVDAMNENELHALNQCVVGRLRILQQQRVQQDMTQFRLGDVVRFINNDGQEVTGVLIRLNKKSVSVHSETGGRWTVSPRFLKLIKRPAITMDTEQKTQRLTEYQVFPNKLTH